MSDKQPGFFTLRANAKSLRHDLIGYWSYPVFVQNDDKIFWMYLVFKYRRQLQKKKILLFRPKSALLTLPNSNVVVRYDNFFLGHDPFLGVDWDKPIGEYPHRDIAPLTADVFRRLELKLIDLCDSQTDRISDENEFSSEFATYWQYLTHPDTLYFIKILAPEFCKKINRPKYDKDLLQLN